MPQAFHKVRSQRWLVRTRSATEAFSWRRILHDQGSDLVMPAFQQAFDEAAPDERVLHIPRLELHVTIDSEAELAAVLPNAILRQLREKLQQAPAGAARPADQERGWLEAPAIEERFAVLLHYLRTGLVLWHGPDGLASEQAGALLATCRAEWPRLLDYLRRERVEPAFVVRLLQLISGTECRSMIEGLTETLPATERSAAAQCLTALLDPGTGWLSLHSRLHLAAGFLAASRNGLESSVISDFCATMLAMIPMAERQALPGFIATLPLPAARLFLEKMPGIGHEAGEAGLALKEQGAGTPGSLPQVAAGQERNAAEVQLPSVYIEAEDHAVPPSDREPSVRHELSAELFPLLVQQAGMVLLHPFLPRLFGNTGITGEEANALSPLLLPRAAALLYLLATGREDIYEYELGLIKVLLGLHPETALPVGKGLVMQNDRDEVEALLRSVIDHWRVLKNTSVQGLRASFLERPGLLRAEEAGWRLNVERRPYDLLLDQLPWSITIVKLPWMKRAIFTEW